jgi:hypothetical protein
MKRMSLTKTLCLALGCATLLFGGTSASAREFSAFAGTTFILVPVPSTSPQLFTHTVDGVVEVSPLGACTVHFDLTVITTSDSKRPYDVEGTQTITTADGKSSVTSSVKGYLSSNPANASFLGINYKMTFISGTGQLAGAHGKTSLSGFAALAMNPGYLDLPGTLDVYPPDADLMLPGSGNLTGKACWTMKGNLTLRGRDCDEDDDLKP